LLAIPAVAVVYVLFFQVHTIDFFPTYISLNYILRKRVIECADIDFVSMETRRTNTGGIPWTVNYVRMKLRSGKKIDLFGFQDGLYGKLKACESTNEQFLLRGR